MLIIPPDFVFFLFLSETVGSHPKNQYEKIDLSKLVYLLSQVFHAASVMQTNYDIAK